MKIAYLNSSVTITDLIQDGISSNVCHIQEIATSAPQLQIRLNRAIVRELEKYEIEYTANTTMHIRINKTLVAVDQATEQVDFELRTIVNDYIPFSEYIDLQLSRFFKNPENIDG